MMPLLAAWLVAASAQDLAAARAEFDAFPADYTASVVYAWAAWNDGDPDASLEGWRRAEALSSRNLETTTGSVLPLVALQRWREAAAAARDAVTLAPQEPLPWTIRGWAWRYRPLVLGIGESEARRSYRTAVALDPDAGAAWCGLGWLRLARGDRLGAARAFALSGSECGPGASARARPRWTGGAALLGAVSGWSGHPSRAVGGGGVVQAWFAHGELVSARLTGRTVAVGLRPDAVGGSVRQHEGWAELGVGHAGSGVKLVGGLPGGTSGAGQVAGVRAWATLGATGRVELACARWTDAAQRQVAGGLAVPLGIPITAEARVQSTSLRFDAGGSVSGLGGTLAARWTGDGPVQAVVGGRVGTEWRPIRVDEPSVWNLLEPLRGGGFGGLDVAVSPTIRVVGSYDVAALGGVWNPDFQGEVSGTSVAHVGVLGVSGRFGTRQGSDSEMARGRRLGGYTRLPHTAAAATDRTTWDGE
ncbi:MAG: hypothetical protein ACI8PZ_004342 [Myxococcota bacterium]|jgi:hypothetical protein